MVIRTILFFSLMLSQLAQAELVIEITQGKQSAIPIAVVPFGFQGTTALPQDVSKIIADDLARSGYFNSMKKAQMLSLPNKMSEVFFRDWQLLKQDYIVIGSTEPRPAGGYAVTFRLVDVNTGDVLLAHKYSAGPTGLRDIAHKISDRIFASLTGIPGAFSTHLIYVTTNRDRTRFNLSYADADGAREQSVFSSKQPIISPSWAPDGKSVAYASFETGRSAIYIQDLATSKRRKIASFKGSNSAPAFSPDGTKMAMVLSKDGNPEVYVMDLATKALTRLTHHYGIDTEPQWMPDGKSLVFTSSRAGKPQIYKLDIASKKASRLTFEGNYNARARVTADGRKLVMVHRRGKQFHIATQDLKSGLVRILTTETELDESPSVAPNGSMIVYAAKSAGRSILAAVSLDGDVKFRLPSKLGDVREPAWSPLIK